VKSLLKQLDFFGKSPAKSVPPVTEAAFMEQFAKNPVAAIARQLFAMSQRMQPKAGMTYEAPKFPPETTPDQWRSSWLGRKPIDAARCFVSADLPEFQPMMDRNEAEPGIAKVDMERGGIYVPYTWLR